MVDKEKLLYRRQYFIGPRPFEGEGRWNTIKISNKHILSYHSDLNLVISSISNKKIILLGNIIDSKNPILTDEEIISSLLKKSKNADDVFEYLADTCGRYVIILLWDEDFRIFSDSCGLRQIFYHIDEDKNVWCASQPHLIGRNLKLKIDNKKKEDFIKTPLFRGDNYWFPGKITLFDRVFHLLPNHYIDLNLASTRRYWPRRILPKREVSEAIKSASEILTNIIEGAYLRYDLAFSISCGWDSRILLSVCRKVADKIRYITLAPTSGSNQDPDVYITRRMLNNLKLK